MLIFFLLLGTVLHCTSLNGLFPVNQLLHNLESSPLGEQCIADSISNGSESEEVVD